MTRSPGTTPDRPAAKAPIELRAADGFGPIDSPTFPRTHEAPRTPCLAGRWFSPRPHRKPAPTLAPQLVND